jgi:hypothetical protein
MASTTHKEHKQAVNDHAIIEFDGFNEKISQLNRQTVSKFRFNS